MRKSTRGYSVEYVGHVDGPLIVKRKLYDVRGETVSLADEMYEDGVQQCYTDRAAIQFLKVARISAVDLPEYWTMLEQCVAWSWGLA